MRTARVDIEPSSGSSSVSDVAISMKRESGDTSSPPKRQRHAVVGLTLARRKHQPPPLLSYRAVERDGIDSSTYSDSSSCPVVDSTVKSLQDDVESHLQQEAQAIFDKIVKRLQSYAKRGEDITYKLLATVAGFAGRKGKTVKRLYALWEAHCKGNVFLIEDAYHTTGANSCANGVIVTGAVKLIPAASIDTVRSRQKQFHPRCSVGRVMDTDNTDGFRASSVPKSALWKRLTTKLDDVGLIWTDLPSGDELSAVFREMGFSAIQRIHLHKMLLEALDSE